MFIKFNQYPGTSGILDSYFVTINFNDMTWLGQHLWKHVDIHLSNHFYEPLSGPVIGLWGTTKQSVPEIVERVVSCFNDWRCLQVRATGGRPSSDVISPPPLYPRGAKSRLR